MTEVFMVGPLPTSHPRFSLLLTTVVLGLNGDGVLPPPTPMSEEEKQRHEKQRQANASYQAGRCHQEGLERKYNDMYDETDYVLRKYFPSEDDLKQLRDNVVSNLRTQEKEIDQR